MKNIDKKSGIKYIDIYRKSDYKLVITLLYSKENEIFAEHISKYFNFYYKCTVTFIVGKINNITKNKTIYSKFIPIPIDIKSIIPVLSRYRSNILTSLMIPDFFINSFKYKTECLINGKKIEYDACDSRDLKRAKEDYKDWEYLGSSNVYYIDGVRNKSNKINHYFKRGKINEC